MRYENKEDTMTDLNALMATMITGKITDENEQNYYIQKEGLIFRLPKTEGDFAIGDDVTGFAYGQGRKATIDSNRTHSHARRLRLGDCN